MSIAEDFETRATKWARHCQSVMLSSDISDYLNHASFHRLVELGRDVIPYIMARYEKDNLPWGFVLEKITGLGKIQDPNRFNPTETKKRWLQWWETEQQADEKDAVEPAGAKSSAGEHD